MATIRTEERNNILCNYVNAQEGIRIYLLPNVPMDAGEIPVEKEFDLEKAVSIFPVNLREG